jgi:hypothetical protein
LLRANKPDEKIYFKENLFNNNIYLSNCFFLDLEQQILDFNVKIPCYNTETKLKHTFCQFLLFENDFLRLRVQKVAALM